MGTTGKLDEIDMTDDLANEIVTALASGAGNSLAAEGVRALGRLIAALRDKFRSEPQSRGMLEIAIEAPDDSDARQNLASLLRERCFEDPDFREWLEALWTPMSQDLAVDQSRASNVVHGEVRGHVVQSRDVLGGIRIGPVDCWADPASKD
jgi:Mn-containing catalase